METAIGNDPQTGLLYKSLFTLDDVNTQKMTLARMVPVRGSMTAPNARISGAFPKRKISVSNRPCTRYRTGPLVACDRQLTLSMVLCATNECGR